MTQEQTKALDALLSVIPARELLAAIAVRQKALAAEADASMELPAISLGAAGEAALYAALAAPANSRDCAEAALEVQRAIAARDLGRILRWLVIEHRRLLAKFPHLQATVERKETPTQ